MKYSKYLLLLLIAIMIVATFVEKYHGTSFAYAHIYGAWWFTILWALLVAGSIFGMIKSKIHTNIPLFLLHLSFIVILAGALCTKLWGEQGQVLLEKGKPNVTQDITLPFTLELDTFRIAYYAGTDAPSDYISSVTVEGRKADISMNNILTHKGYRFYQSSFGTDGTTSVLSVNRDVAGIPITYTGYALFVVSMLWLGISLWRKQLLVIALLLSPTLLSANVEKKEAAGFGTLNMLYNGRIAPVSTFAHDFTLKMNGKTSVGEYNAEQVLMGFLFFPDKWEIAPPEQTKKGIQKWNDKNQLLYMLHSGELLKLFPLTIEGQVQWFTPTQQLPEEISEENAHFIRTILTDYYQALQDKDETKCEAIVQQIRDFQRQNASDILPSETKQKTELCYLKYDITSLLFKVNLTIGILALLSFFFYKKRWLVNTFFVILLASFTLHTLSIALRTYIGGRLPLFANGFEVMWLMAWGAMLGTIVYWIRTKRFSPIQAFGFLVSGFALLVAHLGMMNPRMTPLVPVLSSPLLSFHVSSIMIAYTLLAFTSLNSMVALVLAKRKDGEYLETAKRQNLLCLFPAVFFLGTGIFIGAVWANVSWGRYWGWDPKETWALITFLAYGLLLHKSFAPKGLVAFHIVSLLNFLTVLMTYFGVNYFLGGMHSY